MSDKILNMEAAAQWVSDGDQVVMSAGMDWAPMAMLRELARRKVKALRLVGIVGSAINFDMPIGAGMVASVDTCHVGMGTFARDAPNFVRHLTRGQVKMLDNT